MTQGLTIGATLAGSYLLGSLPFGLWIAKKMRGVDIRTLGSGNIGATNVWRTCGPVAGSLAFTFDVGKGLIPPLVSAHLGLLPAWVILSALTAIIGHNYSVWLGFRGGKGIATSLGALLGVAPTAGLIAFGLFGLILLTLRWVSLGSIAGAIALPFLMAWLYPGDNWRLGFSLFAGAMAIYKHRANIQRLRAGTEPRIHLFGKKQASPSLPSVAVTEDRPPTLAPPTEKDSPANAPR